MNFRDITDRFKKGNFPLKITFWGGPDVHSYMEKALDTKEDSPDETEVQWFDIDPLDEDMESIASELADHAQDNPDNAHLTKDAIIESAKSLWVDGLVSVNELELLCAELIGKNQHEKMVSERLEDEKREPTPGEKRARKWVKEKERLESEKSNDKRRLMERIIRESERCSRSSL